MKTYDELINDVATVLVEGNIDNEFGGGQGNKGPSNDVVQLLHSVSGVDTETIKEDIRFCANRKYKFARLSWNKVVHGEFDFHLA
jgi:hypothetical protein